MNDLRKAILLLVQANIRWRARAFAAQAVLNRHIQAQKDLGGKTAAQIQADIAQVAAAVTPQFESQATEVEKQPIPTDPAFVSALQWYASQQLRED